jgi:hypothetical protein
MSSSVTVRKATASPWLVSTVKEGPAPLPPPALLPPASKVNYMCQLSLASQHVCTSAFRSATVAVAMETALVMHMQNLFVGSGQHDKQSLP